MKVTVCGKQRVAKSRIKQRKQTNFYFLNSLSKFSKHKPSDNRIDRMNRRQRKAWGVREFTEYGCSIVFELTNGMPVDWETTGIDNLLDILDKYHLDTTVGWDGSWPSMNRFKLNVYNYPNCYRKLGYQFVQLVANEINDKVFHGKVSEIIMNFDALWED